MYAGKFGTMAESGFGTEDQPRHPLLPLHRSLVSFKLSGVCAVANPAGPLRFPRLGGLGLAKTGAFERSRKAHGLRRRF
jgi:hypothetical protein